LFQSYNLVINLLLFVGDGLK